MKQFKDHCRYTLITVLILAVSFAASIFLQNRLAIGEHVTTTFAFAVFLISRLTQGYFYGIAAAFAATIAINYAFTFPYFHINFTIPTNLYSAIVMIFISVFTSTLTTKIKHQEAVKAESEKERMRANLLRAVSHDLRTPLTTIYGSCTALLDQRDALSPAQQETMLSGIREDAQWLVRMVENLLSITRIDTGKVKICKTPVVLDDLIDTVILKFRKHYPHQQVRLDMPNEILLIPMDAMLIVQVLINLLENAVQHATGMTDLLIRVSVQDGKALFEVQDNGCGIREDKLDRIFSGYDVNEGTPPDNRKRNSGIGLSVCASIIRAHGSQIHARNARDGGAIFSFTLDLEDNEHEQ